jgi:hypothetical protein
MNMKMWADQIQLHTKNKRIPVVIVATHADSDQQLMSKQDLVEFILSGWQYVQMDCSKNDENLREVVSELLTSKIPEGTITQM